jgi:Transposase DDE domain
VSEYRDGYKAHVAVEPETRLVTGASLTPASAADGPTGVELLAGEEPGLQVLADSAYRSGEDRAALRRGRHHQAIEAIPLRRAVPAASTATISSSTTPRAPHAALLVTRSSHRLRQRKRFNVIATAAARYAIAARPRRPAARSNPRTRH